MLLVVKNWQTGFKPDSYLDAIRDNKKIGGKEAWKHFRELCIPKWSKAFVSTVKHATGTDRFTHVVAVTKLTGDALAWIEDESFSENIGGNPLKILTAEEMFDRMRSTLGTTLAATEVGRLFQIIVAAEYDVHA